MFYLKIYDIDEAVKITVEYSIEEGILAEFLRKNKAEVIPRMIYECNLEEEMKKIGDDRYEDGFMIGKEEGREEGREETLVEMVTKLFNTGMTYEQISQILELPLEKVKDYVNEKSEMVK